MADNGLTRSSLLIQKMVTNAPTVNIYKQWNIVCTNMPLPKYEVKDIPVHDFNDENGDDAYIPSFMPLKAYDIVMEFAYKGSLDNCYNDIFLGFFAYLLGSAPANYDYDTITEGGFKIYDRFNKIGRQKVYVKLFDPENVVHINDGDHLTFKLTFRVTDPVTDITLTDPNASVTL